MWRRSKRLLVSTSRRNFCAPGNQNVVVIGGTGGVGRYVVQQPTDQRRLPQNALLYVVFGDPALAPFEALSKAVGE